MSLTITANLKDLTGASNVGWAVFTLVGFGTAVPRISGTCVISSIALTAVANGSGAISQAVIGNDAITPSGTTYVVAIYASNGDFIASNRYSFTGSGTIDLSTQVPL